MIADEFDKDIVEAGKKAGAYLDRIGVTDLAKMTKEQYYDFCAILCHEYTALKPPF